MIDPVQTEQAIREIAQERATSFGLASDMAMLGGTPATFEVETGADRSFGTSGDVIGGTVSVAAPAAAPQASFALPHVGVSENMAPGAIVTGGIAAAPSGSGASLAIGAAPTGSGSVSPAIAGTVESIGISAAALADAIGDLASLVRPDAPATLPQLDALQQQLQSFGGQAQQIAIGTVPVLAPAGTLGTASDLTDDRVAAIPAGATADTLAGVADEVEASAATLLSGTTGVVLATTGDVAAATIGAVTDAATSTLGVVADSGGALLDATGDVASAGVAAVQATATGALEVVGDVTETSVPALGTAAASVIDTAAVATEAVVATTGSAVADAAGVVADGGNGIVAETGAALEQLGGSDPPGGMATLHDLLAGEQAFELVDAAETVVFASGPAALGDIADVGAGLVDTIITTPGDPLGLDDDHHGLLGGLGLHLGGGDDHG